MTAAACMSSGASVLNKLDGYMAAAGYDTDHPWRSEIATALAAPAMTLSNKDGVLDAADDITTGIAVTRSSMRGLGEKAGRESLKDLEGCVDPAAAFEGWRAHCRAELVEEHKNHVDLAGLVTAWELGFDSVQPLGLAPKEMEVLKAFRLADARGRESIHDYALGQAEDWPRHTFAAPHLPTPGAA